MMVGPTAELAGGSADVSAPEAGSGHLQAQGGIAILVGGVQGTSTVSKQAAGKRPATDVGGQPKKAKLSIMI